MPHKPVVTVYVSANAFSFRSSVRPYARFARVTRETASPFLKAASIMRVKGEKRNVSSYPWKLCGRYTFHAFLSSHLSNLPTRSHTRKLVHPFWICFSYAWLFKRVCSNPPTLLSRPFGILCVRVYVCRSPVRLGLPLSSFSLRAFSPLPLFLSLSLGSHECPRKYRTWKWGERLLNFLPVFYYSGKLSTAFQARALYGRFR